MEQKQKIWLFLLRISLGWLMFYAGVTKVLNPEWSAEGYLKGAKTLSSLYAWFASPGLLPITNFVNEWGLTLLGTAFILGIGTRLFSYFGAALMLLYYFPALDGFYPNAHSFIVDEHIIYAFALVFAGSLYAGRSWGLYGYLERKNFFATRPALRKWLS